MKHLHETNWFKSILMYQISYFFKTLKAKPVIEQSKRSLYYWINLQFNVVDRDRRKLIGPDLSCAEWILRNGGSVKWKKGTVTDYNELPQDTKDFHLNEIDASDTNIMKAGFEHFQGCKYIEKLKLHKCIYINDECLQGLHVLKDSLKHLTISSCKEVTDAGILQLIVLKKLQTLVLADLPGVKNMSVTIQDLQKCLGQCKIQ